MFSLYRKDYRPICHSERSEESRRSTYPRMSNHPLVDSKNTVNQTQHLTHLGALGCLTELWDERVAGAVKVLQVALFEIIQEMLCNNFVFKRRQFSFYRAF